MALSKYLTDSSNYLTCVTTVDRHVTYLCHHAGVSLRARAASAWRILGPGFVTGSSDDDPSGIQTYSQTGAQFGYSQLWVAAWTYPFMSAIQEICGRIGMVTGRGLASVLREHYSRPVLPLRHVRQRPPIQPSRPVNPTCRCVTSYGPQRALLPTTRPSAVGVATVSTKRQG
jgi:hypothetical protein